ncbi:uncharacterized protein LOC125473240 [Pyrus x bretschneideri]|uniref:uncharacterized protein LOC125473240 n=1 Tax=Pyrus x bretschneideri TaxID=225117 RepID=UPI00202ECDBA|nr:uncharacterized protein LOC125473240 [Pyrus x bretschneideri]
MGAQPQPLNPELPDLHLLPATQGGQICCALDSILVKLVYTFKSLNGAIDFPPSSSRLMPISAPSSSPTASSSQSLQGRQIDGAQPRGEDERPLQLPLCRLGFVRAMISNEKGHEKSSKLKQPTALQLPHLFSDLQPSSPLFSSSPFVRFSSKKTKTKK